MMLVLLVSKVNISPISSSDTPALAFGDAKRLSRGSEPLVLILQHQIIYVFYITKSSISYNAMVVDVHRSVHFNTTKVTLVTANLPVACVMTWGEGGNTTAKVWPVWGSNCGGGARFSAPVQIGPGAHPASCTMGTGSFLGVESSRGMTLTPQPLIVPWSRKGRDYTPTPRLSRMAHTESQCLYKGALYGQWCEKVPTVPTGNESTNTDANLFSYWGSKFSLLLHHLISFPTFWRDTLPSSAWLWACELTPNPEDEGGRFLWNFSNQLPNHTTQQPRRPGSSAVTWCKPQITVLLLHIYLFLIILSFSFVVFCCCITDFLWQNEMIRAIITFKQELITVLLYTGQAIYI
jgi:hypothetical protein